MTISFSTHTVQENRTMTDRRQQLEAVQREGLELFSRKNQDYGDAFAECGPVGVVVRIGDKLSRLRSVTAQRITLVNDETLRDTLLDLHNYAAMAIALMDEQTASKSQAAGSDQLM